MYNRHFYCRGSNVKPLSYSGQKMIFFRITVCLFAVTFAMSSVADAQRRGADDEQISFTNDVAPIINAKCGTCHVRASRGRYNIKSYKALIDSDSVDAKNPDDSLFIEVIESGEMPKGGLKVSDKELETLREWISQGAKFDGDRESAAINTGGGSRASSRQSGRSRGQSSRGQSSRGQSSRGQSSRGLSSRGSRTQGRSNSRRSSGSSRGGSSRSNAIESNKLLAFLDGNRDGKISLKEIDAASRILRSLDANGDGRLTGDELEEFGKQGN